MSLKQVAASLGILPAARAAKRSVHRARVAFLEWRLGAPWANGGSVMRRTYRDYEHYKEHQKSKLDALGASNVDAGLDAPLYRVLMERLARYAFPRGTTVVCLAARRGGEVRAFIEHGCFAVGIDLNPGPENQYVVVGDFHHLQFADGSVDVVFTNSLDHALELDKVFAEVVRILKPGGRFLVETAYGFNETDLPSHWEATFWATTADLVERISAHGLALVERLDIEQPHKGVHLQFRSGAHAPVARA
jgi:SAM-dependent methyltransferase